MGYGEGEGGGRCGTYDVAELRVALGIDVAEFRLSLRIHIAQFRLALGVLGREC